MRVLLVALDLNKDYTKKILNNAINNLVVFPLFAYVVSLGIVFYQNCLYRKIEYEEIEKRFVIFCGSCSTKTLFLKTIFSEFSNKKNEKNDLSSRWTYYFERDVC